MRRLAPPAPLPPSTATAYIPTSWWSYIGLAYTTPLPASPQVTPSIRSNNNVDVPDIILDPVPDPQAPPLSETTSQLAPAPNSRPPSIFSAETSTSRPSWYAAWIGWGSPAPEPVASSIVDDTAQQGPVVAVDELTQAEQVKAEALARDDGPPPSPAAEASPILNNETRASWVSFFSSRNRAYTKAITDGSEAAASPEMEVMDIDEEVAPSSYKDSIVSPPATPNNKTSKAGTGAPPASPQPIPSRSPNKVTVARPIPSPSSKNGDAPGTQDTPAPPLTGSKDVKKKTSSATNPGKKDPPSKLPNLVLPTWGDTFYAAPRSFPPPTKASTLTRTFNVMKGLLSAPAHIPNPELDSYQQERKKRLADSLSNIPISPSRSPEVYEDEQRRISQFVGTDLPRALSVLGQGVHGSEMGRIKRIAIIGVHGCVLSLICGINRSPLPFFWVLHHGSLILMILAYLASNLAPWGSYFHLISHCNP